ncbi:transcription factor GTE7-like [Canna indica]|uniref:Transcription factor GTE7-like n=1 Tax=Canna indica TaxID=4628 RepID=A0AAQ3JRL4_9LILI|nr:transcription factor GTE7-like [Canna indica]
MLMASAILASSNEPYWLENNDFMKNPISNPNPRSGPNPYAGDYAGERSTRFHAMEQEAPPDSTAAVSEDSSSFKRNASGLNRRWEPGGAVGGHYVSFNISTYSRMELRELKRRLAFELEQVRSLISRIESRDIQSSRLARLGPTGNQSSGRDVNSASLHPLGSLPSRGSDPSLAAPRNTDKLRSAMMKKCGQILSKLMKNKKSIWFNSPVDAVAMSLHDYFQIIKNPMDLGTVKTKLNKGLYPSPEDFAADIRLTFNNALIYNPEGHEVHMLADQYLRQFESLFLPAYQRYEMQLSSIGQEERLMLSTGSRVPLGEMASKPKPLPALPPPMATSKAPPPRPIPTVSNPASVPPLIQDKHPQQQTQPNVARTVAGKLPKPKAKDPNKRSMSLEEKQKLSDGLQSLPPEKMANVLHIVRKRNVHAMQNGDEIELDIDTMDTDTLWDLDRFLCNCKKMLNKMKRQEAIARNLIPPSSTGHSASAPSARAETGDGSPMAIDTDETSAANKVKKGSAAEEDVDIGDNLPLANYPSVEIEKDTGCASSSSSSDSDSSSSSSSDSDSSTDSDSDGDEAQSPRNQN